jgi:hypothetical protein
MQRRGGAEKKKTHTHSLVVFLQWEKKNTVSCLVHPHQQCITLLLPACVDRMLERTAQARHKITQSWPPARGCYCWKRDVTQFQAGIGDGVGQHGRDVILWQDAVLRNPSSTSPRVFKGEKARTRSTSFVCIPRDENGRKRSKKQLNCFCFHIFWSGRKRKRKSTVEIRDRKCRLFENDRKR